MLPLENSLNPHNPTLSSICSLPSSLSDQDVYELGLVSQYLDLNQESINNNKNNSYSELSSEIALQKPKRNKFLLKKVSIFHNFQKHIILTFKKNIKIKRALSFGSSKIALAQQLWDYIVTSYKTSKKWFLAILGNNLQLNKEVSNDPKWANMKERIEQAGETELHSAQQYLRNAIVRQAHAMLKRKTLKVRRIKRIQEFESYFIEFVNELQLGVASLRLPKLKRMQLEMKAEPLNTN